MLLLTTVLECRVMPANERRFWVGKCGHVMGEIRRVMVGEHHKVRALWLYRHSVREANDVSEELPPKRMLIIGTVNEIECTICGCTRDWILGEDGLKQILDEVRREV